MVRHQLIPLDAPDEWRNALVGITHGFANTWEHCYAMHLTTGLKTYLYCYEEDSVRITCPIVEREFGGSIDIAKPFGFSGFAGNSACPDFAQHWREFARQRGYVCGYLGLDPLFGDSTYFEPTDAYQHNGLYILDLTPRYDELFANLHMNRKRQLRNWSDVVPSIVLDKRAVTDFFLSNYLDFMRAKNAPSFYYFSRETLAFLASLDNVLLVGAPDAASLESVSVFFYTPSGGEYFINISLPEGRHHAVTLLWYGANYLKSLDVPLLNLGGSSKENDGMAQFKERFGSKKIPLKSLKQVYAPDSYERICRQVGADPHDMTGYFPAYRASR
jgi:hypothetical protein